MEQDSSCEANRPSASQKIPRILWNAEIHCPIHNSLPFVSILSLINRVHAPSHVLKIHFNIILPSTLRSSEWSLSLRFPYQSLTRTSPLPHTRHMLRPSHSWYDHNSNIWLGLQIITLSVMQSSPLPCYLVSLMPKYPPQHPIPKHPQPTFLSQSEWPSFTPTQNNRLNYISIYPNLYIFGQQTWR